MSLAYIGPETALPVSSALAMVLGTVLAFWPRVKRGVRTVFRLGRQPSAPQSKPSPMPGAAVDEPTPAPGDLAVPRASMAGEAAPICRR